MQSLCGVLVVLSVLGASLALPGPGFFDKPLFPPVAANPTALDLQRVLDNAVLTIQKASNDTVESAVVARARVDDVVRSLQAAVDDTVRSAAAVVENLVNVFDVSSQLIDVVNANVSTINSCLAAKGSDFGNLMTQTGRNMVACVTDKIRVAEEIVRDVVRLAAEAAAIGPNAIAGLATCKATSFLDLWPPIRCVLDEVNKATTASARIVLDLAQNVAKATGLVATLQVDLQRCAVFRVFEFVLKSGNVAGEAGLCVVQGLL